MDERKTRTEMLKALEIMLDEDRNYADRLAAYEYLLEDCEEIVEDMIAHIYTEQGDTGKMLMEVLARYKDNKAIFMGLVSYLYKGDDVALFAKLIGSYGNEQGVEVLKTFCEQYEPNYNEYMEIRNAVEELGGDIDIKEDFSDDPLYRFLKGLDEEDDDSRRSPFEDYFRDSQKQDADESDECDDEDCGCHHHDCDDEDCGCHHHDCGDEDCDCHHRHE